MFSVVYDTVSIRNLIKNFRILTGVNISFCSFDRRVRIFGNGIENGMIGAEFCNTLRKNSTADKQCMECDKNALVKAIEKKGVSIYKCHAALTEIIAPVFFDDKMIGYFIMGKLLESPPCEESWQETKKMCSNYDIDMEELKENFYLLSFMDTEKLQSAAEILNMCAKYIYMSRIAQVREPQLIEKISEFVDMYLANNITINDLSVNMNLSKSHLSHLIKSQLGISFGEYIQKRRIEKAIDLLVQSNISIKLIANEVGLSDQNYFSRAFKNCTGMAPKKYRSEYTIKENQF